MTSPQRTFCLIVALAGLFPGRAGAAARAPAPVSIEASPAVLTAARALGGDVAFFTSPRRPLSRIGDLQQPQREVASPHLGLARGVMGLLRAGGVPLDSGAAELMTLVGERQLSRIFAGPVRLVIVRASEAGPVQQAGGVPLLFRGAGGADVGAAPPAVTAAVPAPPDPRSTSFGALTSARLAPAARARQGAGGKLETLSARAGQQFLILTIARDFGRGVGAVSFLYGSGIIVEPAFDQLQVDVEGKPRAPKAINADGLTLELGYEVPAGAKKVTLVDGGVRVPIEVVGP